MTNENTIEAMVAHTALTYSLHDMLWMKLPEIQIPDHINYVAQHVAHYCELSGQDASVARRDLLEIMPRMLMCRDAPFNEVVEWLYQKCGVTRDPDYDYGDLPLACEAVIKARLGVEVREQTDYRPDGTVDTDDVPKYLEYVKILHLLVDEYFCGVRYQLPVEEEIAQEPG